jgi:Glyceraldehyde 3-phosphate dehydrogenase, NAD binding domain
VTIGQPVGAAGAVGAPAVRCRRRPAGRGSTPASRACISSSPRWSGWAIATSARARSASSRPRSSAMPHSVTTWSTVFFSGFGRIGRSFVRSAYERGADLEIVASTTSPDPATLAHLSTYDSVYGQFAPEVTCEGGVIAFDGREIGVLGERDPGDLPWADLGVDVVIEETGRFRTRADAERHP